MCCSGGQFLQKRDNQSKMYFLSYLQLFEVTAQDLFHRYHNEAGFKELVDPKKDSFLLDDKAEHDLQNRRKGKCCM